MYDLVCSESFDIEKIKDYILSIQVSLDGFSFSVIDPAEKMLLVFKDSPAKISTESLIGRRFNEWIKSEEFLQKKYKKIFISVCLDQFSIVPENYFIEKNRFSVSKLLFGENKNSEVVDIGLGIVPFRLLFNVPKNLISSFKNNFENMEISHPVRRIIEIAAETNVNRLFLNFSAHGFNFILWSNNKIQLANSFSYAHINDVVYFVLSTLKQLQINSKHLILILAGQISGNNEIGNILNPYFKKVKYWEFTQVVNPGLVKKPIHKYLSLV